SRPPPISTVLPYTTLFRSLPGDEGHAHDVRPLRARERDQRGPRGGAVPGLARRRVGPGVGDRLLGGGRRGVGGPPAAAVWCGGQDRKSTRLNSSHEWISYA